MGVGMRWYSFTTPLTTNGDFLMSAISRPFLFQVSTRGAHTHILNVPVCCLSLPVSNRKLY